MAVGGSRGRLLRIASHCPNKEKFLQVFRRFSDDNAIFIPTKNPKPVGDEIRFAITVNSGEPLIAGRGRVAEAYTDKDNRFRRRGMLLSFLYLDEKSQVVVNELAEREVSDPPPAESSSPPRKEGSGDFTLPANPLAGLAEESLLGFVECSLYEDMKAEIDDPEEGGDAAEDGAPGDDLDAGDTVVRDTRVDDLMPELGDDRAKAARPKLGRVPDIPLPRVNPPGAPSSGAVPASLAGDDAERTITKPETPLGRKESTDIGEAKTLLGLNAMDLPPSATAGGDGRPPTFEPVPPFAPQGDVAESAPPPGPTESGPMPVAASPTEYGPMRSPGGAVSVQPGMSAVAPEQRPLPGVTPHGPPNAPGGPGSQGQPVPANGANGQFAGGPNGHAPAGPNGQPEGVVGGPVGQQSATPGPMQAYQPEPQQHTPSPAPVMAPQPGQGMAPQPGQGMAPPPMQGAPQHTPTPAPATGPAAPQGMPGPYPGRDYAGQEFAAGTFPQAQVPGRAQSQPTTSSSSKKWLFIVVGVIAVAAAVALAVVFVGGDSGSVASGEGDDSAETGASNAGADEDTTASSGDTEDAANESEDSAGDTAAAGEDGQGDSVAEESADGAEEGADGEEAGEELAAGEEAEGAEGGEGEDAEGAEGEELAAGEETEGAEGAEGAEGEDPEGGEEGAAGDAEALAAVDTSAPADGGGCKVALRSAPRQVEVSLGETVLGKTPFTAEVPCGDVELTFAKKRFQNQTKKLTVAPAKQAKAFVRMRRPRFRLVVVSQPKGSIVQVQGRTIGKTPARTTVNGYEKTRIYVTKPGHKSKSLTVFPSRNGQRVRVKLEKRNIPKR